jgi:hypothetical protein
MKYLALLKAIGQRFKELESAPDKAKMAGVMQTLNELSQIGLIPEGWKGFLVKLIKGTS